MCAQINNYKTFWCAEKIKENCQNFFVLNGVYPKVAIFGLAFKPNIDDFRESPALHIAESLSKFNGISRLSAVEPNIQELEYFELIDINEAIDSSDFMVFLVGHNEFNHLKIPTNKMVLDFTGIIE